MILKIYSEQEPYAVIKEFDISSLHICYHVFNLGIGLCYYAYGDEGLLINSSGKCVLI